MCFDIDVNKLTLVQLRETLRRIAMLLSQPSVLDSLPDKGHQLHQVREKLKKEITFRESLEETRKRVEALSLKCASDTNIVASHSTKICAFERKPQRERFKPHSSLKPSGRTESAKELHSGTKLIDLTTSLSIQKFQEERVKEEQIRAKHERLLNFLKQNETDNDSDETDWILNDYDSDEGSQEEGEEEEEGNTEVTILYSLDEPGPSGLGMHKKRKIQPKEEENDNEINIAPKDKETKNLEKEPEIIQPKADMKIDVDEPKNETEELQDKIQLNTDTKQLKSQAMDLKKEAKNPKEIIQLKTEVEAEMLKEPDKKIQSHSDTNEQKPAAMEKSKEIIQPKTEVKVEAEKPLEETGGPKEKKQSHSHLDELQLAAMELDIGSEEPDPEKDSSFPKDEADMP